MREVPPLSRVVGNLESSKSELDFALDYHKNTKNKILRYFRERPLIHSFFSLSRHALAPPPLPPRTKGAGGGGVGGITNLKETSLGVTRALFISVERYHAWHLFFALFLHVQP